MENRISIQKLVGGGYYDFWNTRARYRVCKGGRGSKKSKTAALNRIYRIVKYPQSNYLCIRRYQTTLRDSVFADCQWAIDRMGLTNQFKSTISPMEMIYIPTGQKILFRGLDSGIKLTSISIASGVLNYVDIEEAYEITEDDFNKLDMSIRGEVPTGYFKQLTLIFNPWSSQSWLKKRFFDHPDEDTFTKTTTYRCNEWLDEADRKIFEKMKTNNPRRFRIEGDGDWGISVGRIYEKVTTEEFDINEIRRLPGVKAAFGLDFGFTDPTAFVALLVDNDQSKIYVFDEWYKSGVTNQQIASQIKNMGYGSQRIICDCAEPKSIMELMDTGIYAFPSRKGPDSVKHGIQQIQNYEIIVHPRCKEFRNEIVNYCWMTDKNGKPTEVPDHEFSHGMDAMRYGVSKILMPPTFSFD